MIRGKCWKLEDNVSTDHIISGKYKFGAIDSLDAMVPHVLEEVIPDFYKKVRKGDVIVAGRNFGKGSSREQAPRLLKMVGVSAVVAKSFSHIFFRNAINVGLLVVVAQKVPDVSETGDTVEVDPEGGVVRNVTKGVEETVNALPSEVTAILKAGGIVEYIKNHGAPPWLKGTE
ncbi:MAG: 3-isopropylmalate dehydratase [Thermofilaceae archaeon]|nr:3-isopropylmalate dehydratase [Thermofilaceae archaeon]MCX8179867.1 3-isopropylmalate dehydratase [Thermofilaceae archaeon]MDW8004448.1 3-isopropylmalate dehydratase [Thermofilaceae archaeon]